MLLAVDVGNTQTVLGLYRGRTRIACWRLATVRERTGDELGVLVEGLLAPHGGRRALAGAALGSVVPSLDHAMREALAPARVLELTARAPFSFEVGVPAPERVGIDRLVNAEAALALGPAPVVVVDAGTAIKTSVVGPSRRFLGGAIAPGLETAAAGLFARAAKLAPVALEPPAGRLGESTEEALRIGLLVGMGGLVDRLVAVAREAVGEDAPVVATGGSWHRLGAFVRTPHRFEPDLTLEGIRLLAARAGLGEA